MSKVLLYVHISIHTPFSLSVAATSSLEGRTSAESEPEGLLLPASMVIHTITDTLNSLVTSLYVKK